MKHIPLFLPLIVGICAVCCLQSCQPADTTIAPGARSTVVVPSDSTPDPSGVYSPWMSVSFVQTGTTYAGTMVAEDLTDEFLNDNRVRVYMRDGEKVVSLPYTQQVNGESQYIYASIQIGQIDIISSGELPSRRFRYVVSPHKPVPPGGPLQVLNDIRR